MILLPAPPRAGRNVYHLSFSAAAWELQLSRLELPQIKTSCKPVPPQQKQDVLALLAPCPGVGLTVRTNPLTCTEGHGEWILINLGHKFVLWPKGVWFAVSLGLKSEQSPVDLLVSVTDGIIQRPLPHWRICKVSLQLPGLKRLRDLIIFGTCLSQIQWKSANRLWNYGKVEWTNIELQKALESRLKMRLKPGSWVHHSCHPHVIYLWAWMDGTQDHIRLTLSLQAVITFEI